jgi:pyridinium-3,5-bisthiocarboxylic acid mononucleotide nickel chelatase
VRLLWIDAVPEATLAQLRTLAPPAVDRIVVRERGRLAFLADEIGPLPPCVPLDVRYGNGIRLVIGAFAPVGHEYRQRLTVVEALVDRVDADLLDRMRALGAADAWAAPVHTGTVAYRLTVLTPPDRVPAIRQVVPGNAYPVERIALARAQRTVTYRGCPISVKLALHNGCVLTAQPEYDDVRRAARTLRIPARQILADLR